MVGQQSFPLKDGGHIAAKLTGSVAVTTGFEIVLLSDFFLRDMWSMGFAPKQGSKQQKGDQQIVTSHGGSLYRVEEGTVCRKAYRNA